MYFNEKQVEYFRNIDKARWIVKEGSVRSGKTFADYFAIPMIIRQQAGLKGTTLILGNTLTSVKRNIIEPMQGIYGDLIGNVRTDGSCDMFGEKVYIIGCDKESQAERLRGMECKFAYCDEATSYSEATFDMLKTRLSAPYSKCILTLNPDSELHWMYKFLYKTEGLDMWRQHYTIGDNPKLSADFVVNLKRELEGQPHLYKRYILGQWCLAEGIIYPQFNDSKIVDTSQVKPIRYIIGVDYGIENATSFVLIGVVGGVKYVLKEYYYSGRQTKRPKTDADYVVDLKQFIKEIPVERVIVDPSASSFIEALRREGIPIQKAKNDVLDGIRNVATDFSMGRLFIDKSCRNGIEELKSYHWKKKSGNQDTDTIKEEPEKVQDHFCDALRYGVMYLNQRVGTAQF